MRYLSSLILLLIITLWSSCRKDFEYTSSTGNLEFSADTLFLDTVFSNIGSSTYNFKVYNNTDNDLVISSIALERGDNSNYRLNVDGLAGKSFENIPVLAQDSIFVFVETTTDITQQTGDVEFLYTDRILFDPNGTQQDVDLVTLVKDAVFLFPARDDQGMVETLPIGNNIEIEGFFLDDTELTFTNEKPYVIYGYAAIPSGKTLTIDPGARIHFHESSGLIAANNATLLINGAISTDPEALENEVIIEGDRLEPSFSDVAGQWGFIWLTSGSTGHVINHTTIKNGTLGILMDGDPNNTNPNTPTLTITNSQIYNSALYGVLAKTANISGENLVINNAGISSLACTFGGNYNFNHCTFANYWGSSFRDSPSIQINNFFEFNDEDGNPNILTEDLIAANFTNCIIDGNKNLEVSILQEDNGGLFNYKFTNSLIRFNDFSGEFENNPFYDFDNASIFENVILNEDSNFKNPFENELNIGEASAANGQATTPTSGTDILGTVRDATAPDIGAYESTIFAINN